MNHRKVRVGVLLDSLTVPAWQYRVVRDLLNLRHVTIETVIVDDSRHDSNFGRLTAQVMYWVNRHGEQLPPGYDDLFCPVALVDNDNAIDLGGPPIVHLTKHSKKRREIIATLGSCNIDVVVVIGNPELAHDLSIPPKCGLWYFWHSSNTTTERDGSTVGLREFLNGEPYLHGALHVRLGGQQPTLVANETYSSIYRRSYVRTRHEHLKKLSLLLLRTLERLGATDSGTFLDELQPGPAVNDVDGTKYRRTPSNGAILYSFLAYAARRISSSLIAKLYSERWVLLFKRSPEDTSLQNFQLLAPPEGRFWADPFVFRKEGDYFVFFEDASVVTGHGHIAVMQFKPNSDCAPPKAILSKPYHLSYPFVFSWESNIYMIPESADNNSVDLYRFRSFPSELEHIQTLLRGVCAYDATLIEHDERWWMFATIRQAVDTSPSDELYIFHAESPVSKKWYAHPMNPVLSDIRRARPAGRIFSHEGRLYRPSQNCSFRYGYSLNFNVIDELTTNTYREHLVADITPDKTFQFQAIHTWNQCDDIVFVDAVHRAPRSFLRRPRSLFQKPY